MKNVVYVKTELVHPHPKNPRKELRGIEELAESIKVKGILQNPTVYHRLNIAKLDDKILKKKEEDKSFQLSMQDLYALEKIEDVKERNRVLKEANCSSNLKWMTEQAVKKVQEKRKRKIYEKLFKEAGIERAKESVNLYDGKWDQVKHFDFDEEPPKALKLPKTKEPMFYFENYIGMYVIKKAAKKAKTKYEIEREEKEAKKKQIKNVIKNLNKRRKEFLQEILSGKIEQVKEEPDIKEEIWNVLLEGDSRINMYNIRYFFTEKYYYDCSQEELKEADKKIAGLSMTEQMLIAMNYMLNNISDIYDYSGKYKKSTGEAMVSAYEVLKRYGWYFEEGEEDILNGKSPLYEEG